MARRGGSLRASPRRLIGRAGRPRASAFCFVGAPLVGALLALMGSGCSRPGGESAAGGASQGASASAGKAGPARPGCEGLFDPPEGGLKLCDEHVMAMNAEIHWTSWAVTTSRLETFRPYRERAGKCGASVTFKPPLLSVGKENLRLSVHDANEAGAPSCATKPGAAHASVVVISTKYER
jgi:hypothetical protein